VRIHFSPFRFAVCALGALCLFGAPIFSQQRLEQGVERETFRSKDTTESNGAPNAAANGNAPAHHVGAVNDWTHNHMLYPRVGPMQRLIGVQKDPRAIQHWQEGFRKEYRGWRGGERFRPEHHSRPAFHRDWSIPLGSGSTANAMYPSKWTFDTNEDLTGATADTGACAADYAVFPVKVAPLVATTGQPNIVGLNNLYSGIDPVSMLPNGICDRPGPPTTDDLTSATTLFSYAVVADDGVVATSPTTSLDGTKIAFVEGTTGAAHFHVLSWRAGDGTAGAVSRQDAVAGALQITSFNSNAPLAGDGTVTDLMLATTDHLSSPFVDYTYDVAYVGDDGGNLYRIVNVFCTVNCTPGASLAPSLDTTWGSGGVLTIGGTCAGPLSGALSGVVVDGFTGNVYVGCADGFLYGFDSTGNPLTNSPLQVGDGTTFGGLNDPPIVDSVNGWVYVETMSGFGLGTPIVEQVGTTDFSSHMVATLGTETTNTFNMHAPAFNDAYLTSTDPTTWQLYDYAADTGNGGEFVLYGIGFTGAHVMNPGNPTNSDPFAFGQFEVSPVTQFLTTGGEDRIFASVIGLGNTASFNITNTSNPPTGFPATFESAINEGTGTSGIVVDNTSNALQANSIYFGVLGTTGPNPNSAVKLTQTNLF
jgi:hypothetical protein